MSKGQQDSGTSPMPPESDGSLSPDAKEQSMGKEERKRWVLGLLVETNTALPPTVIFHNVKRRGADFERRSVDNYLNELEESGYIKKTDEKRGYYEATERGREYYYKR